MVYPEVPGGVSLFMVVNLDGAHWYHHGITSSSCAQLPSKSKVHPRENVLGEVDGLGRFGHTTLLHHVPRRPAPSTRDSEDWSKYDGIAKQYTKHYGVCNYVSVLSML